MESDILADCAARLIRAGIDSVTVVKVISEMRRVYGGDECYVHAVDRHARDKAIAEALTAGLPVKQIAVKAKCHSSTVRRIREQWEL